MFAPDPDAANPARLTLALYQPDIAQNAGTILRLCACLGLDAAIIEPAGFSISDRHFRRAGMDYLDHVAISRHVSFSAFDAARRASGARLILLSAHGRLAYTAFRFQAGDILMVGRETAGVPPPVHASADERLAIPLRPGMRCLNVAVAAAMVAGEALRQIELAAPATGAIGRERLAS